MLQVTDKEIENRLRFDNPWWETGVVAERFRGWPKRAYAAGLHKLATAPGVNRAVILLGPRRAGKTVLIHQTIQRLIEEGIAPTSILYVSVDTPVYGHLSLESLFGSFLSLHRHRADRRFFLFFDEIQYHKDWERHLKSLVDSYPHARFVASGSAAAALRMKSRESGAGRFTDFLLPPLTFLEFLMMSGIKPPAEGYKSEAGVAETNRRLIDYLNYGGFPEAVFEEAVRKSMDRYIANDIIDKVLLRDLPSLYGIADTSELNRLFTVLAYNTGAEVNLESLAQTANIAKNTLRRYLEYLEAAFLIHRLYRVDHNARRFQRETHFKVYLTNPSIRAALFGAIGSEDEAMGRLVETAFIGQLVHSDAIENLHYARWPNGEVDFVMLDRRTQRPELVLEAKWSDRAVERPREELKPLLEFCKRSSIGSAEVLTRSRHHVEIIDGVRLTFAPAAVECLNFGLLYIADPLEKGRHPRPAIRLDEASNRKRR